MKAVELKVAKMLGRHRSPQAEAIGTNSASTPVAAVPLREGAGAKLELDPLLTDRSRGADQFRFAAAISGRIVSSCWSMGSRGLRQICFLLGAITALACVTRVDVPPAFGRDAASVPDRIIMTSKVVNTDESKVECVTRLRDFIAELDELLNSDPHSIRPVFNLLNRYFPLENCDINEAIKICRQSKYFRGVDEQPKSYVIWFSSAGFFQHPGVFVTFSLLKESGNSRFPSAKFNK